MHSTHSKHTSKLVSAPTVLQKKTRSIADYLYWGHDNDSSFVGVKSQSEQVRSLGDIVEIIPNTKIQTSKNPDPPGQDSTQSLIRETDQMLPTPFSSTSLTFTMSTGLSTEPMMVPCIPSTDPKPLSPTPDGSTHGIRQVRKVLNIPPLGQSIKPLIQSSSDGIEPYTINGQFIVDNSCAQWIEGLTKQGIRDPFNMIEKKSAEILDGFYDDIISPIDLYSIGSLRRYSNRFLRKNSMVTVDQEMKPLDFVDVSRIGTKFFSSSAPVEAGFRNFFKFVYENVNLILMLTPFIENRSKKADQYVFGDPSDYFAGTYRFYGEFGVKSEIVETNPVNNIIVTKVSIKKLPPKEQDLVQPDRVIYHIHFTGWTDHHIPDHKEFCYVNTIYEKYMVLQHSADLNGSSDKFKPLIHCSAGIGRTGTWIAIQYLIEIFNGSDSGSIDSMLLTKVNLIELIMMLRNHRAGMIQTFVQFQFIYNYIRQHLIEISCDTAV